MMTTAATKPRKQQALPESNTSAPSAQTNKQTEGTDDDDVMGVTIRIVTQCPVNVGKAICCFLFVFVFLW